MKSRLHGLVGLLVLAALIMGSFGGASAVVIGKTIVVHSIGMTGSTPSPTDNDFTRIDNAIHSAVSGDTIKLVGAFNFAEANAAASWRLGHDGLFGPPNQIDDYTVDVPAGLNNITLTADYLGAATIQGPGDLPTADLEGFLQFYNNGTNQNWTISNLRILDFDLSIGMFWRSGNHFDGTKITNNYIRIATDLKGVDGGPEDYQNIGIHLAYGKNQTISLNTIDIPGDGQSDPATAGQNWWTYGATPGYLYSGNVALQSNTHGGDSYDGLTITGNTVRVLNAQSANPARIIGIWENGWGHSSNVTVSNNQFVSQAAGNDPTLNRQMAFRPTSHSSAGTTVRYYNNTVQGASIGFGPFDATTGLQPIQINANTLTNVNRGILLGAYQNYTLTNNRLTNSGAMSGIGAGVEVAANGTATIGSAGGSNFISGFATGIDAGGTVTVRNSKLSGNGTGLLVHDAGTASINRSEISGNTVHGVNNLTVPTLDATYNWWGSASGPGGAPNDAAGPWNTTPYAGALVSATTASTHEIGETATLQTTVTGNGVYGAQLRVNHDNSVLNFASGTANAVASTPPWAWDILQENFVPVPGGRRISGTMQRPAHTVGANLTGESIATWNYTCVGAGTSALTYDLSAGTGTFLSDINGLEIPAAFVGDSVTCTPETAGSVDGYIKLQGRLGGQAAPLGWYASSVTLACVSGGCVGYGPYVMTSDDAGHYKWLKTGPGTGVVLGTYSATVSRRAYLGATKAMNVTVVAGSSNTINDSASAPQLWGGNVNDDGVIGIGDLSAIGGAFGNAVTPDTGSDVNGDGWVNIFDLTLAGGNYDKISSTWP